MAKPVIFGRISEQVSREHAEFTISGERGRRPRSGQPQWHPGQWQGPDADACQLKDRDLVQVGPLTFAVSILDAPAAAVAAKAKPAATAAPAPKAHHPMTSRADDIDSWLVGPNAGAAADQPTAVYGGDTITITRLQGDAAASPKPPARHRHRPLLPCPTMNTNASPRTKPVEIEESFEEESERRRGFRRRHSGRRRIERG